MKASDNPFTSLLITEGTEPTAPAAGKQRLYIDSTTHKLKRTDSSGVDVTIEPASSAGADGWTAITATLTYSSVDGPTGVATTSVDLTGLISVGMRVKLTQTTVKYFIVTAINATTITLYGGTDYVLANAAITLPYYAIVKAPLGFPLDVAKWTETFSDTADRTQSSPVSGTWYNIGTSLLAIPIGCWRVQYAVVLSVARSVSGGMSVHPTLSTANNSETDLAMSTMVYTTVGTQVLQFVSRERALTLAAKTSYFLNAKTSDASMTSLSYNGTKGTTQIRAICAYL